MVFSAIDSSISVFADRLGEQGLISFCFMVSVVTTTSTMEELIFSDADITLMSQIFKSASERSLSEAAPELKIHSPSFSNVSKIKPNNFKSMVWIV